MSTSTDHTSIDDSTGIAPVVKQRHLACSAEHAFEVFTSQIGQWWPTDTHAIGDDVADVVLEPRVGGTMHEVAADGTTTVWGEVLAWDPPHLVRFSWHLQRPEPTEVEVRFTPTDEGCVLDLVHSGWEAWGEVGEARRSDYDSGWEFVLDRCQSSAMASSSNSSDAS